VILFWLEDVEGEVDQRLLQKGLENGHFSWKIMSSPSTLVPAGKLRWCSSRRFRAFAMKP
jgi:hypothetical protein